MSHLPATLKTIQLSLPQVEKQVEYQGVEMGVLENGVPYLSERGLLSCAASGVHH